MYSNNKGGVGWIDLTVEAASELRDFYVSVVGWESSPVSMGDYDDYNMVAPDDASDCVGICHARGPNADLPAQWLIYFNVGDIDESLSAVRTQGGEILRDKTTMGGLDMAVIRDPAGAVCALVSKAPA